MAHMAWLISALAAAFVLIAEPSHARSLVWVRASDTPTLDPHALNEGLTNAFLHHVYEPLVIRDTRGKLRPALATRWNVTDNPKIWIFEIREGVKFHDGSPLTVEDVLFSLKRARLPHSDMKLRLAGVKAVTRIDKRTIAIETKGRDPLLPMQLTDIFIMSRAWAEAHNALEPQPASAKAKNYAATNANGTGPFEIVSRVPGKETKLKRNDAYWEPLPDITELTYRVIPDPQLRVSELTAGKVDFVQDLPVDRIAELVRDPDVTVKSGPENRVIFLGTNVTKVRRTPTDPNTPNPLADHRVRQALELALDRRAIQRDVMHGQSIPTAVAAPPTINGYPQRFDHLRPPNPAKARTLLKEAGYDRGFTIPLDCPNNRYSNDTEICKAIATQLRTALGLTVNVRLRPQAEHFPLIRHGKSDFYLMGWGVPTFDSEYVFRHLYHSAPRNAPSWNGTGYKDDKVDHLIESIALETDLTQRNQTIADIWWRVHAERIYIPIHVQTLNYAMRKGIDIEVDISDSPKLKSTRFGPMPPASPN